jgi:hypothetical protein
MTTDHEKAAVAAAEAMATSDICAALTSAGGGVNAAVTVLYTRMRQLQAMPRSSPQVERLQQEIVESVRVVIRARHELLHALGMAGLRVELAHESLHAAFAVGKQEGLPFPEGQAGDIPVDRWPVPAWMMLRALAADAGANAAITSVMFAWTAPQ